MSGLRLAYKQTLVCSFCGKAAGEVERLIAGPTVLICNECVALCQGILNEVDDEAVGRAFTAAQEARAADIARGIVAEILQGADARIRDAIDASLRDPSAPIASDESVR